MNRYIKSTLINEVELYCELCLTSTPLNSYDSLLKIKPLKIKAINSKLITFQTSKFS
ncbi:hypothetical protein VCRA2110O2_80176 [Vibrio crassostreae]|nr:hypothetical protein VCRA2110O2_80176 [Vibrio crassostreae]